MDTTVYDREWQGKNSKVDYSKKCIEMGAKRVKKENKEPVR